MFTKKKIAPIAHDIGNSEYGNSNGGADFKDFISPKGLEKWKPAAGANKIDIIPYNASSSHPLVVSGQCEEGDGLYSLDIYVHKGIGPSKSNIPCLRQFGKRCPLCDESRRLQGLGTEEGKAASSEIYARRRVVYLVHDLNTGKYGYWDTGFKSVEQKINAAASFEVDENTGAKIDIYDWEEGKTIRFMGTEKTWNGHKFVEPDGFGFINRKPLSEEVLDHSVDLSTFLNMVSEEDMEKIISGQVVQTSTPNRAPTSAEDKAVDEKTDAEYAELEKENSAPSFDSMEPVSQKPSTAKPAEAALSGNVCPCGHKWGEADSHSECATCDVWEKCIG